MVVTADEVMFRGLKNQANRIPEEDRVMLVYGRNLDDAGINVIKELLKLCRTQVGPRKALKKRDDVTKEEILQIKDEFFNQFLPEGWYFDGSAYRTRDGFCSSLEHPNLELLIQRHLDEINDEIGEYNRSLRKQVQEEQKQYE